MKKMKKSIITTVILAAIIGISIPAYSQYTVYNTTTGLHAQGNNRFTVPSPNASAITAVASAPVNLSTGQLGMDIPLYTIQHQDISVPISLNYNYSGFKPNDHHSWVGLGWNLNAGGAIVRVKKGEVDEARLFNCTVSSSYFYTTSVLGAYNQRGDKTSQFYTSGGIEHFLDLNNPNRQTDIGGYNSALKLSQIIQPHQCQTSTGPFDMEPDEFTFNFNGNYGKIIFKLASTNSVEPIITTNSSNIYKVTYELGDDCPTGFTGPADKFAKYIKKFTLYSYDGYSYEFGGTYGTNANMEITFGPLSKEWGYLGDDPGNNAYISAWYLAKITSPQNATVTFNYAREGHSALLYPTVDIERFDPVETNVAFWRTNYNKYATPVNSNIYLTDIVAGDTKVEFNLARISNLRGIGLDFNKPTHPEFQAMGVDNYKDVCYFETVVPDYIDKIGTNIDSRTFGILSDYKTLYDGSVSGLTTTEGYNSFTSFPYYFQKLTDIKISNRSNLIKGYTFDYYSSKRYIVGYDTRDEDALEYNFGDSKTGRLELKEIKMHSSNTNEFLPFYKFEYFMPSAFANEPKAKYGTRCTDHWGYLNRFDDHDYFYYPTGARYKDTLGDIDLYNIMEAQYYASRQPNATTIPTANFINPSVVGALSSITYPTGARTEIEYENNDYRNRVEYNTSSNSIGLHNESSNVRAGGIRVKKTISWDNANYSTTASALIKEYYYCSDYPTGSVSSGILNSGKPVYITDGISNLYPINVTPFTNSASSRSGYRKLSDKADFPNVFDGNYIIYSKVIEKNSDGSYKRYTFSNSDGGANYIDEVTSFNETGGLYDNGYPFDFFYSKADARGKLLQEDFFKGSGALARSVSYTYNAEPLKETDKPIYYFKKNTRELPNIDHPVLPNPLSALRSYIGRYTTFYDYLKEKTVTEYVTGGSLLSATLYTYDAYRNQLSESFTNSSGETRKITTGFSHPYRVPASVTNPQLVSPIDPNTADAFSKSLNYLINNQLFSLPVERLTTITKNGTDYVTGAEMYEYDNFHPLVKSVSKLELNAPVTNYASPVVSPNTAGSGTLIRDSRYRDQAVQNFYEISTNTYTNFKYLSGAKEDEQKVALIRDNNLRDLVAVVKNAEFSDVAYCNFDRTYGASASFNDNKGRWTFPVLSALQTTPPGGLASGGNYYDLQSGNISKNDLITGKKYRLSFWVKNSSSSVQATSGSTNLSFTTGRVYNSSWTYKECEFTAQGASLVLSGTGNIDELRLCPSEATMETYSYNLLGNVTFKCDALNHLEFYTYDNFGRLLLVINEDGNIVRKHQYGNLITE
jgi:hypothetical protein